ncbi:MAG: ABC transporter permease [Verrucomicrobia bacterium]|nr:ABC transporter permease [Verrucomicrobiota bacterium]
MNPSAEQIVSRQGAWSRFVLQPVAGVGNFVCTQWDEVRHATAVIGTALSVCVRPRYWVRTVRRALAHQVVTIGVESVGFVCGVAVFVGIAVVVQLTFWIGEAGQSQMLGPLLLTVVARELGPVLINLVVIVRCGSAMATELGIMKIGGRVRVLEAQGIAPFTYLVVPRVLGAAISTFCLTILFILVAFASGYLFGVMLGKGSSDWLLFANSVFNAVRPEDVSNVVAKSILPALFASASCCIGGLGVTGSVLAVPQATQRALARSVTGMFVICAVVSLLTYL